MQGNMRCVLSYSVYGSLFMLHSVYIPPQDSVMSNLVFNSLQLLWTTGGTAHHPPLTVAQVARSCRKLKPRLIVRVRIRFWPHSINMGGVWLTDEKKKKFPGDRGLLQQCCGGEVLQHLSHLSAQVHSRLEGHTASVILMVSKVNFILNVMARRVLLTLSLSAVLKRECSQLCVVYAHCVCARFGCLLVFGHNGRPRGAVW